MAQSNVRFLHAHLTDEQLVGYYQRCRAFVFAGDEDFGIAAVEAQGAGKPVIAYGRKVSRDGDRWENRNIIL